MQERQNYVKAPLDSEHTFNAPLSVLKTRNGLFWYFFKDHLLLDNGLERQKISFSHLVKKNNAQKVGLNVLERDQGIVFSVDSTLFYIDFHTHTIRQLETGNKGFILGLAATDNGAIWLATLYNIHVSSGLEQPFKKLDTPEHITKDQNPLIMALRIIALPDNKVLVSTSKSKLIEISQDSAGKYQFTKLPFVNYHPKNDFFYDIKKHNEMVIIGARHGLYQFNLVTHSQKRLENAPQVVTVRTISLDGDTIWFTANGQLYTTNNDFESLQKVGTQSNFDFDLDSSWVRDIYTDDESNVWLSLNDKGLYQFSKSNNKFNAFYLTGQTADQPLVLHRIDQSRQFPPLFTTTDASYYGTSKVPTEEGVMAFYAVSDNEYWFGTFNKLAHVVNHQEVLSTEVQQRNVLSIIALDKVVWYTRSTGGLYQYDVESDQHTPMEALDRKQFMIELNDQGQLVSFNLSGIDIIDPDNPQSVRRLQNFKHPPIDVRKDNNGVYLYFDNGDIALFDLITASYQKLDFAPSTTQCVVRQQEGNLWWLTQEDGTLVRYQKQGNIFNNYNTNDGLPPGGVDGKYCGLFAGQPVFSTGQGLIKPTQYLEYRNQRPPKVAIETTINGQIQNDSSVIVPSDGFPLGFTITNSSFQNRNKNQLHFRITGLSQNWRKLPPTINQLNYSVLPQGKYVLTAKVSNNDGLFSESVDLPFTVLPPMWLTWWAKLLYLLGLAALGTAIYFYRTQAIRAKALKLEKVVAQKTAQISEEKQTIEKLLNMKEQEFIHVSHELRTPLTLISGPIKAAGELTDNSVIKNHLQMASRNSERLHRMVDQMLHLERFKFSNVLAKSPQNIAFIVQTTTESFRIYAAQKQISIELDCIDNYSMLFVPDAFEKIIVNLLSNAIKYTGNNGTVTVSGKITDSKGFQLCVKDNGIGIKPDDLTHIFEKFYRVSDQSSEKETGAGVGLALVQTLVTSHEGKIDINSTYGEGTTISVSFGGHLAIADRIESPTVNEELLSQEISSLGITPAKAALELPEQSSGNKLSLLVIEDNPDMQQYIVDMMSDNYTCHVTSNGQAGLDKAFEVIPDLIICDVMMPVMDGFEATKRLKENEITSHIPVIMLTARGDKDSRLTGWKSLADEYIAKPFDEEELMLRSTNLISIRSILRQRFGEKVKSGESLTSESESSLNEKDAQFIDKVTTQINDNLHDEDYTVEKLSQNVFVSERQLLRKLKALIDMTPKEYLQHLRLLRAEVLLLKGTRVSEVSDLTGFSSSSYFARCFKAKYNVTPKQFSLQAQ